MKEILSLQISLIVELEKFEKTWKKQQIGLDKSVNLVYNTSMLNEKKTIKEKKMTERQAEFIICGTFVLVIIAGSIFGAWALLQTL